ncbi:hypothetical protein MNB_SV-6-1419 [hydrothermal vent metagenome]|uniref:DUF4139 domain-containing protein n=1 Tax=hydrothermal vent metagenome TaxID=652676 RepID=A0A1W1BLY3_9ZZZZ
MKKLILYSAILLASTINAENIATTTNSKDLSLTIYGANTAMISEKRSAIIADEGRVKLVYSGVPSMIDTSSVLATFSQPVKLYSQNYSYDVVNYNSLLKYHLGKEVYYLEKEESLERKQGILLSSNPILIREIGDGDIYTPYKIFFPDIPKEMAIKPSLFWNIETSAKSIDVELKYLTKGLKWKSDYTLDISDKKNLSLNSWITITNNSGATYKDADITVLAGEVNMPQEERGIYYAKRRSVAQPSVAYDSANIENQSFSGYHIYHIPFKESIKDKEKKQISFISKDSIPYERYALNKDNLYFGDQKERKLNFQQIIEFKNSKSNHLGIPLPKGTVRVYQKDDSGVSRFVGATDIGNIPKDESVKLNIGKYFDITGKEKIVKFRKTSREKHITFEIMLNNRGESDQVVKLKKNTPVNSGKLTIKDNCKEPCKSKDINAFSKIYTISLKKSEEYNLTISYDIKRY